jgi:hypothetical protein
MRRIKTVKNEQNYLIFMGKLKEIGHRLTEANLFLLFQFSFNLKVFVGILMFGWMEGDIWIRGWIEKKLMGMDGSSILRVDIFMMAEMFMVENDDFREQIWWGN